MAEPVGEQVAHQIGENLGHGFEVIAVIATLMIISVGVLVIVLVVHWLRTRDRRSSSGE